MNCKPNDLAIVVKADQMLGAIVKVIGDPAQHELYGLCWLIEYERGMDCYDWAGKYSGFRTQFHFPDSHLRPIRGNDPIQEREEERVA